MKKAFLFSKKTTKVGSIPLLLLGLFLISVVSCNSKSGKDDLEHNSKVFKWYMEQMELPIPDRWHKYILIPSIVCSGCAKTAVNDLFYPSDSTTLIITAGIASLYLDPQAKGDIVIDTSALINTLNWDLGNVIELHTEKGEVLFAKSYTAEELGQ